MPRDNQHRINQVARGVRDQFISFSIATCGGDSRRPQEAFYTQLIKNAAAVGIKITAGGIGASKLTTAYTLNALAMAVESKFLSVLHNKLGDVWMSVGTKSLLKHRLGEDKQIAEYIASQSTSGSSVAYWNAAHVLSDLPNSLRRSFPDALALSFCASARENGQGIVDAQGLSRKPANFLLDLSAATVRKYVS